MSKKRSSRVLIDLDVNTLSRKSSSKQLIRISNLDSEGCSPILTSKYATKAKPSENNSYNNTSEEISAISPMPSSRARSLTKIKLNHRKNSDKYCMSKIIHQVENYFFNLGYCWVFSDINYGQTLKLLKHLGYIKF